MTQQALVQIVINEDEYWRDAPPVLGPDDRHPKEFVMIHVFVSSETRDIIDDCFKNNQQAEIIVHSAKRGTWKFRAMIAEFEQKSKRSDGHCLVMFTARFADAVGPANFMMPR